MSASQAARRRICAQCGRLRFIPLYLLGCCANCDELARQRFAEDQAAARELVSA